MRLVDVCKMFIVTLLFSSFSAQATKVFYVLDTSSREQSELLNEINSFYRKDNQLANSVTVIDISPQEQWFVGEVDYFNDRSGDMVANLKPSSIPSLLFVDDGGRITRTDLKFLQGSGFSADKLSLLLKRGNRE